jgi:hypothetical protein
MEKLVWLESEVQNKLDLIQKIIIDKESSRENDSIFIIPVNFAVERLFLLGMAFAEYNGAKDYFYSDSRFIGCGIREMVFFVRKDKNYR